MPYDLPQPDKFANAGLGWLLTPGRLLDPSTASAENPLNPGPNWVYVSSDGGHHALYPSLHPGYPATPSANGTLYSNDGTYLRQKKLAGTDCRAVAGTTNDCRIVEFPDGATKTAKQASGLVAGTWTNDATAKRLRNRSFRSSAG